MTNLGHFVMIYCTLYSVLYTPLCRPLSVMWDSELDCTESEAVARRKAGEGRKEGEK